MLPILALTEASGKRNRCQPLEGFGGEQDDGLVVAGHLREDPRPFHIGDVIPAEEDGVFPVAGEQEGDYPVTSAPHTPLRQACSPVA